MNIDIIGEIDAEMLARVRRQLEEPADKIDLVIESNGGNFDYAVDMYLAILAHPAAKTAWIGNASSSALLIAIACNRRVAVRDAQILLHRVRWIGPPGDEADLIAADRETALILEYRTGTLAATFLAEMQNEEPAPLDWCLRTKLITEIHDGKISHTEH